MSARAVLKQHRRTGSPSRKAPGPSDARLPSLALGMANASGIETINMICKGQVRWLAKGDIIGQIAQQPGLRLEGDEDLHRIPKGQGRWGLAVDIILQNHLIGRLFGRVR